MLSLLKETLADLVSRQSRFADSPTVRQSDSTIPSRAGDTKRDATEHYINLNSTPCYRYSKVIVRLINLLDRRLLCLYRAPLFLSPACQSDVEFQRTSGALQAPRYY